MRKRCFTLVELLVVIVIVGILLGIAMPAFEKLTVGSGVDAAARTLSASTSLARQFAISQRQPVAVLLPASGTSLSDLRYKSVAFCTVSISGSTCTFTGPVANAKIEYLPVGVVIAELNQTQALTNGNPVDDSAATVGSVDWRQYGVTSSSTSEACRAIVFRPSGALAGETRYYIKAVEGEYTGSMLLVKNRQNIKTMEINGFTGKGSFVQ